VLDVVGLTCDDEEEEEEEEEEEKEEEKESDSAEIAAGDEAISEETETDQAAGEVEDAPIGIEPNENRSVNKKRNQRNAKSRPLKNDNSNSRKNQRQTNSSTDANNMPTDNRMARLMKMEMMRNRLSELLFTSPLRKASILCTVRLGSG
jgi:hypothetical protein